MKNKKHRMSVVMAAEAKPIIDKIYGIDLVVTETDMIGFGLDNKFIYCRPSSSLAPLPVLELISFINEFRPSLYWVWWQKGESIGEKVQEVNGGFIYEHTFKHPGNSNQTPGAGEIIA